VLQQAHRQPELRADLAQQPGCRLEAGLGLVGLAAGGGQAGTEPGRLGVQVGRQLARPEPVDGPEQLLGLAELAKGKGRLHPLDQAHLDPLAAGTELVQPGERLTGGVERLGVAALGLEHDRPAGEVGGPVLEVGQVGQHRTAGQQLRGQLELAPAGVQLGHGRHGTGHDAGPGLGLGHLGQTDYRVVPAAGLDQQVDQLVEEPGLPEPVTQLAGQRQALLEQVEGVAVAVVLAQGERQVVVGAQGG